jgi:hypothetical protein
MNMDTLPKHQPYNWTIDLVEEMQPPFGPIYNLSQDESVMFSEYFNENLENGLIRHSKFLPVPLFSLSKRKMVLCECVSIIMDWIN